MENTHKATPMRRERRFRLLIPSLLVVIFFLVFAVLSVSQSEQAQSIFKTTKEEVQEKSSSQKEAPKSEKKPKIESFRKHEPVDI